jgi:hypothetical protein
VLRCANIFRLGPPDEHLVEDEIRALRDARHAQARIVHLGAGRLPGTAALLVIGGKILSGRTKDQNIVGGAWLLDRQCNCDGGRALNYAGDA